MKTKIHLVATLKFALFFLIILVGMLNNSAAPSKAASTITVCAAGTAGQNGCNYIGGDGIQEAINSAPAGTATDRTTIILKSGLYTRQNTNEFVIPNYIDDNTQRSSKSLFYIKDKHITIKGETNAKIDGANSAPASAFAQDSGSLDISGVEILGLKKEENCDSNVRACGSGHGIMVFNTTDISKIHDIKIKDNQGSGVLIWVGSADIKNAEINKNNIGAYLYDRAKSNISKSSFSENIAAGFYVLHSSELNMQTSNVDRNKAGMDIRNNSKVSIIASTFKKNTNEGLYLDSAELTLKNSIVNENRWGLNMRNEAKATVVNNIFGFNGSGIEEYENSKLTLLNSIAYKNRERGFFAAAPSNYTRIEFNYSFETVSGGDYNQSGIAGFPAAWPPINNYRTYPSFVSETDFHLNTDSTAIDRGDPSIKDPDDSRSDVGIYGGPDACLLDPSIEGCEVVIDDQCLRKPEGDADCVNGINLLDFQIFLEDFTDYLNGEKRMFDADFDSDTKVTLIDYNTWRATYVKEVSQ